MCNSLNPRYLSIVLFLVILVTACRQSVQPEAPDNLPTDSQDPHAVGGEKSTKKPHKISRSQSLPELPANSKTPTEGKNVSTQTPSSPIVASLKKLPEGIQEAGENTAQAIKEVTKNTFQKITRILSSDNLDLAASEQGKQQQRTLGQPKKTETKKNGEKKKKEVKPKAKKGKAAKKEEVKGKKEPKATEKAEKKEKDKKKEKKNSISSRKNRVWKKLKRLLQLSKKGTI